MNTTPPVMTVTDELLAELEEVAYSSEFGVVVEAQWLREALNELRRLRAENAELAKDAERYCFVRRLDNDCFMLNTLQLVSGNELDAAIDTAMAAQ